MYHMIITGAELRRVREKLKISQARLAEITGTPQHLLSSFELGKIQLAHEDICNINSRILNPEKFAPVMTRQKRYRRHSYTNGRSDSARSACCSPSAGNQDYLNAIANLSHIPKPSFTGISLFSGAGGFSLGFRRAGCDIKGYVEIDNGLSGIYKSNFPGSPRLGKDITQVSSSDLYDFIGNVGSIDVIIGGPPCQGFSLAGKRSVDDPRNYLFEDYLRIIDVVAPKVAIIENVRLLTSMRSKNGSLVLSDINRGLKAHGYNSNYFEINASAYGVPQNRERVFFVAVKDQLGIKPSFPEPSHGEKEDIFNDTQPLRSFADACSDLPYLESGESSEDPLHKAVSHPDHVIEWLWNVPQGSSAHKNKNPNLRPPSGYNTTYKRQIWDEPGSTVQTTFGMISGCRNVHPIATRSLTIREAARLQSFPDDYSFIGTLGTIRTGIGNAVPPLLSYKIACHVRSQVLDFIKVSGL